MKKLVLLILFFVGLGSGCANYNHLWIHSPNEKLPHIESFSVIPAGQWRDCARKNGINIRNGECRNPVTVLGHYPEYVELAEQLDAGSMQIPMDQWNAMTEDEQWNTTTTFFDYMMKNDHNFRLATPVEKARPGSYYIRELNYLFGKGYRLSPDGLWLVKYDPVLKKR